jgi:hypothetical protein
MKRIAIALLVLMGCEEKEVSVNDFTGNEVVYALASGSTYNVSGTATIKEKQNGVSVIVVALQGTEAGLEHPVHLHFGSVGIANAEIAALLKPIEGATGLSETTLTTFTNETPISYTALLTLDASIKIHLAAAGPDRDIILAAGNIGSAVSSNSTSRTSIAVCK